MAASTVVPFYLLLCLGAAPPAGQGRSKSVEELLPPPVRQAEKRALFGSNDRFSRFGREGAMSAAFSVDGKLVVMALQHQGMAVWDVGSGRSLGQLRSHSTNVGTCVAFAPKGTQMISATWGTFHGPGEINPVEILDAAKRTHLRDIDEEINDTPFSAVAVAPDGKTLALAAGHGRRGEALALVFWDLASGDEVRRLEGLVDARPGRRGIAPLFEALCYSPDGRTLAALLGGRILLVELATGKVRSEIDFRSAVAGTESPMNRPNQAPLGSLAFAPDGRTVAAGCPDGAVRLFDLRTGREQAPLAGQGSPIIALHWAPDGKRLRSCDTDGHIVGWWAKSARAWKPAPGPLSGAALQELWDTLGGDDPRDLFGCREVLAAAPDQALPFLRKRLAPVPKGDAERIERLIEDVQKGDYNKRRKAVLALRKIGAPAAEALRRAQAKGAGFDNLLYRLSHEFSAMSPASAQTRSLRALGVLERIDNAEARLLLEELAAGSEAAALTVQSKAALAQLSKARPAKAPSTAALWKELAGHDSEAAYRAVRALANRHASASLLRDRLKDLVAKGTFDDDPKRVARMVRELGSDDFATREAAAEGLRSLGRLVAPALRAALKGKPELEAKRRLEELLAAAEKGALPPEVLRAGRALEALELMGGAEARQALVALKDVRVRWLRDAVGESLRRQR
jgi:hypothetical protein